MGCSFMEGDDHHKWLEMVPGILMSATITFLLFSTFPNSQFDSEVLRSQQLQLKWAIASPSSLIEFYLFQTVSGQVTLLSWVSLVSGEDEAVAHRAQLKYESTGKPKTRKDLRRANLRHNILHIPLLLGSEQVSRTQVRNRTCQGVSPEEGLTPSGTGAWSVAPATRPPG